MSEQRIKISLELAKILVGLFTCASIVFYAGMLNEKVINLERRVDALERWKDQTLMNYTKRVN